MESPQPKLTPNDQPIVAVYDLFIAIIAVLAAVLVTWRLLLPEESEIGHLLDYFDFAICVVFLYDFFYNVVNQPHRKRYLLTWGWFDLLSSVPALHALRYLRLARLLRVLRLLRSVRILVRVAQNDRGAACVALTILWAIAGLIAICVGVLVLERDAVNATLTNAEDVIWWAVVTSATVGYGDVYPVTSGGRLLGGLLMFLGIGVFAALAGSIAAWLIHTPREGENLIEGRLTEMTDKIEQLEEKLDQLIITDRSP